MAKITQMPQFSIIDGMKGQVDFYYWRGIACARRWPRYTPREPTPAEAANQALFAEANAVALTISESVKDAWRLMVKGTPWTWKDAFVSQYMTHRRILERHS